MADILQMVLQFLNVNCGIVNCYYPNIFEGLFYLILLPSLIIILFIWFVSGAVIGKFGEHKGFQLLIAVVVYIFIIIEGWYTMFISMSFIWIVLVVIVGILFFIFRHITGGGGAGKMPPVGGGRATGGFLRKGKEIFLGERVIDPIEWGRIKKLIDDEIKILNDQIKRQEDLKADASVQERAEIVKTITRLEERKSYLEKCKRERLRPRPEYTSGGY